MSPFNITLHCFSSLWSAAGPVHGGIQHHHGTEATDRSIGGRPTERQCTVGHVQRGCRGENDDLSVNLGSIVLTRTSELELVGIRSVI